MADDRHFQFRLYVAGESANSIQAIANLKIFCRNHLKDRHEIEIIDVLREPDRGLEARVLLTPTLVTINPVPCRRIVGNLSNTSALRAAFSLDF
jgi:circadian clock protein KaiB